MLTEFENYLTLNNIYMWTNLGVLPFWLMLISFPNSKITQIFTNSIILPLVFSTIYIYVFYQIVLLNDSLIDIFKLYIGLEDLYMVFSSEKFLLIFWVHFLTLNIFLGSWVSRDAFKNNISKKLTFVPLVLLYFSGPLGLVFYWFLRVFYAKRLSFFD